MRLGTNLSFSVKRWVEPESWARVVRQDLDLDLAQFSFDIVDPWWPEELRSSLAKRIRKAVDTEGLTLHSAFVGLSHYTYNQLLHPLEEGRKASMQWYRNAIDFAGELEVEAMGGPAGALSADDVLVAERVDERYAILLDSLSELSEHARKRGLKALLIEPTPLEREFPWSIEMALKMQQDLKGRTAVPIQWCFDWGHAIYEPLYGEKAKDTLSWLKRLAPDINQIQLQQSDGQLDRHWSFTYADGIVNPAQVISEMRQAGLEHLPVFLEVFYPFEWTNHQVMDDMKATIAVLKPVFAA
ncbi:MAG: sugar phosphate isomerase/epimerase [bacterium]|nr:sugar phosphate isomerase/epimerase [bacterium]